MCHCHDTYDDVVKASPGHFVGAVTQRHDEYPDSQRTTKAPAAEPEILPLSAQPAAV